MNDRLNQSTLLLINLLSAKLLKEPNRDRQLLLEEALLEASRHNSLTNDELSILRRKAESFYNLISGRPEKAESIVKMATGAIHDFNNTLTIVMGYSELLSEEGLDEKYKLYLNEILNATKRGSLLAKQILGFSHRKTEKPEIVKLNNFINSLQKMVNRVISEEINLEYQLSAEVCLIKADIALLEQAFIELIFAACDSMPQGGKVLIKCGGKKSSQGCRGFISLSKDGAPMTIEALNRVAALVEESRGVMEVTKEGTAVELSFPEADEMKQPTPAMGKETILLLEGSAETARFLKTGLSSAGYHILTAGSKSELMELLEKRQENISLMITDLLMPNNEGPALLADLNRRFPSMKQLFITDDVEKLVMRYGIEPDKSDIMQKPFTLKSLKNRIRAILD